MSLKLVQSGKGPVASGTGERFLPSVSSHVVLVLLGSDELFGAVGAGVFLGTLAVSALVSVPDTLPAKGFAADGAQERLVVFVVVVSLEVILPGKRFATQVALIRPEAGVNDLVVIPHG